MKVVVGLSGGVDSSVSALLLKQKGYEVIGVSMKIWEGAYSKRRGRPSCYGPEELEDIEDARRVSKNIGIPFYEVDLVKEYREIVLEYFKNEYLKGRTPNPCVRCNQMIKFNALLKKAQNMGIDFDSFATGHYARVEYDEKMKRYILKKGIDSRRDQSYFLYGLSQDQLSILIFPLGEYRKDDVRKIARDFGLNVHDKEESQDFYGGNYRELLDVLDTSGPIIDKYGRVIGTHKGIWNYTIGQRKGIGVLSEKPLYVINIDEKRNALTVGEEKDLYREEFVAGDINWIAIEKLESPMDVSVKIRYKSEETEAQIIPIDENKIRVRFKTPQRAVTPGQVSVFYQQDIVVGGGIIEE